jgi:hypothetical protein
MGVNVMNILAGAVQVITCDVDAPEPDEDDFVSFDYTAAPYRDCGGSNGGVKMVIAQTFGKVTADQTADILASLVDERSVTAEMSLLETTLQNLKMTNNGGDIVTGDEGSKFEPVTNTVETPPDYTKLILRGTSAVSQKRGVLVLRRTLVTSDVGFSFVKNAATMLGVTFTSHYVSDTVPPFAFFQED